MERVAAVGGGNESYAIAADLALASDEVRMSWREKLSLSRRYVVEDVKCNLTLLTSVAARFGLRAPLGNAPVTLIGAATGEDFRQTGRRLDRLGRGELTRPELDEFLRAGLPA